MPTSGEARSLPAWALTSLKRWLRWKASRNFSLCWSARRSWTSLPIMTAQEPRENRMSTARTNFAIGPASQKRSSRLGPCSGPIWNMNAIKPITLSSLYGAEGLVVHRGRLLGDRGQDDLVAAEEIVPGRLDDREGLVQGIHPDRRVEVRGRGIAAFDDLVLDEAAQAAPHGSDEDQGPVLEHLHLEELEHHE